MNLAQELLGRQGYTFTFRKLQKFCQRGQLTKMSKEILCSEDRAYMYIVSFFFQKCPLLKKKKKV